MTDRQQTVGRTDRQIVHLCLSICLLIHLFVCLSVKEKMEDERVTDGKQILTVRQVDRLTDGQTERLFIFVYLSVNPFVCLSVCLSVKEKMEAERVKDGKQILKVRQLHR